MAALPDDPQARKAIPLASGLLDYFPSALVAVAALSAKGNDQHNPGKPLHWDRAKSGDEADALLRHLMQRGTVDDDGVLHSTKVAWRALALLQKELERAGAPLAPGAKASPMSFHGIEIVESPVMDDGEWYIVDERLQAQIARQIEEPDGLKAGEAYMADFGSNPVSQTTGD